VFELPEGASRNYKVTNPFPDQQVMVTALNAGEESTFKLKPFEVLIIEALPSSAPNHSP
jgi:hypothetical protein